MQGTFTFTLPSELVQTLDEMAIRNGVSRDELVAEAVKEHLFLRRFRLLRERMAARAESQGIATDQDVFDRVS